MILDIVTGKDNSILRVKAEPVEVVDQAIKDLIANMKETLASTENGVGLAAPQVGKNLRLFVIGEDMSQDGHTVFINPIITRIARKKVTTQEGCLSLPGQWHELARPEKVTIKAQDENGQRFKLRAKGISARLMLHETDHLEGGLFIDHIR